ncbi:MAG: hypothetical protein MJ235_01655 [archaeon]|nr:hypothetical protein [archaeon]
MGRRLNMANNDKRNMTILGGTRGLGKWLAEHLKDDFNIRSQVVTQAQENLLQMK